MSNTFFHWGGILGGYSPYPHSPGYGPGTKPWPRGPWHAWRKFAVGSICLQRQVAKHASRLLYYGRYCV